MTFALFRRWHQELRKLGLLSDEKEKLLLLQKGPSCLHSPIHRHAIPQFIPLKLPH